MKILIVAPTFWPATKAGGPPRSLTNLARSAAQGHEVTVIAADRDLGDAQPFAATDRQPQDLGGVRLQYVDAGSLPTMLRLLFGKRRHYDAVVLNSIWNRSMSFLPALAIIARRLRGDAVVLQPHGELEPGALALKPRRKSLGGPIARTVYRLAATVVAGSSDSEVRHLRQWFPRHPVLLVSNSPDEVSEGYLPAEPAVPRLLFLGRIHPTKGLREFLLALALCAFPLRVTIAGPVVDAGYWKLCRRLLEQLPSNIAIEVLGPVAREEIAELFWSHEALVTLTAGENFGHTIAESLQAGCPVIATDATPWSSLLLDGAGLLVADRGDAAEIAGVLMDWAAGPVEKWTERRRQARDAYESWRATQPPDVIAAIFEHAGGPKPSTATGMDSPAAGGVAALESARAPDGR